MKLWFLIYLPLLVVDWMLGAAQASGLIPLWTFLIPNLPFGALYVWLESHWAGTHYLVWGQKIGDLGSLVVFLAVVVAQATFYFFAIRLWRGRSKEPPSS